MHPIPIDTRQPRFDREDPWGISENPELAPSGSLQTRCASCPGDARLDDLLPQRVDGVALLVVAGLRHFDEGLVGADDEEAAALRACLIEQIDDG